VVRCAGIIALVGSLASLILGCAVFQEGFAGAMWCFFETPLRDEPNPLIPLLYEIGASACGIAGGIVLLAARGPAVVAACPILIVAGPVLFIPKGVYRLSLFGPIADDYARYGLLLILLGLISTTLPGLMAGFSIAREYLSARRRRAATVPRSRERVPICVGATRRA